MSPQRLTSGGSVFTQDQGQDQHVPDAPTHDSNQLSHQQSGLWGVESNLGRQLSTPARASSPPRRQKSQTSQPSGILRTKSGGLSKLNSDLCTDPKGSSKGDPRADSKGQSGYGHRSPTRAPSRLRESSTEEAEVQYAQSNRDAHKSASSDSSTEEEDRAGHQKPNKCYPRNSAKSATSHYNEEEGKTQTGRCRHSPRGKHASQQKQRGPRPHQYYHTAEEYFSRARVREALSPRKGPASARPYPSKARVLDLHDNCALADEQEDDLQGRASPVQRARASGQGGAQVTLLCSPASHGSKVIYIYLTFGRLNRHCMLLYVGW